MSWTRADDNWHPRMEALGLNAIERDYLFALIQYCSRSNSRDGRLKPFTARTVTETPDPDAVLAHLHDVGRIYWDGTVCVVLHADEHLPSDEVIERSEAEKQKKRRQRAHARGDHSLCSEKTCPSSVPGTVPGQEGDTVTQATKSPSCPPEVPGTVGTGQGGQGLRRTTPTPRASVPSQAGPPPSPPGGVDLTTGELKPCTECQDTTGDCHCFDDPAPVVLVDGTTYDPSMEPSNW